MNDATTTRPPEKYCDIVMKGGITSGVVYPRAVTELAGTYTLKSVGGTSAGAIAAAAAAAAELGRQRNAQNGDFKLLADLPAFLCGMNASGHTNLFTFFQPQPKTRRLFNVLAAALNARSTTQRLLRALGAVMRQFCWATLLGGLPGLLLAWLAWRAQAGPLSLISFLLGIGLAVGGAVLFPIVEFAISFSRRVPQNFFGLCTGMPDGQTKAKSLTEWLTSYLNELAGIDPVGPPLTFGQLWSGASGAGNTDAADSPAIRLEMMTTCLTWGRPFRLPFQNEEAARENRFYFKIEEFEQLFPESVVAWLREHPRKYSRMPPEWRAQGYVPLPEPEDLPVVVATRMSLSFPILLSAIPLYAYELDATEEERKAQPPRRCWFSDGGICSNFPMHFFDSPAPRWPTFAINLTPRPDHTPKPELAKPAMPPDNNSGIQELWDDFDGGPQSGSLFRFLGAIITSMQNWTDNTQARLPGYRDRIAHVGLTSEEGGLNLDMPDTRIRELSERGEAAAKEFIRRFASGTESKMNWDNHRWLRMRSLLASVEEMLERLDRSCSQPAGTDIPYDQWLKQTRMGGEPSYRWYDAQQRTLAIETMDKLRALAAHLRAGSTRLEERAPRPRPQLRPRPRI